MEGDGFLTDILLNGGDGDVAGLDDLNFPIIWVVELLNFSLLIFLIQQDLFWFSRSIMDQYVIHLTIK